MRVNYSHAFAVTNILHNLILQHRSFAATRTADDVLVALALILFAWVFVAFWYVLIYVVFGILFIPYRMLRRSSRKQKQAKLRHREVLEAIEKNRKL